MREEIVEKLTDIFREVFDDDSIEITDTLTADDVEGWDSLMHITLIGAIESEFQIKFSMRDILSMKNVGALIDKIEELV